MSFCPTHVYVTQDEARARLRRIDRSSRPTGTLPNQRVPPDLQKFQPEESHRRITREITKLH